MNTLKLIVAGTLLSGSLIPLNTGAQVKENDFVINGSVKNISPMPSKVYLSISFPDRQTIDSAEVRDGKYHFEGSIDRVRAGDIMSSKRKNGVSVGTDLLHFLVDKGTLNIVSDGRLKDAVFSGSGAGAANGNIAAMKVFTLAGDTLQKIMKSEEYAKSLQLQQAVNIKISNMIGQVGKQLLAYVKAHPQSPVSTYYIIDSFSKDEHIPVSTVDSLFNLLPADQQASIKEEYLVNMEKKKLKDELANLTKEANRKMAVGKTAVDFTQNDTNGNPVTLSSFKGKYVLVDFWASWCGPCRAENPNVVKAFNTYSAKGFTVLGVSLDSENAKDAWLAAIAKDGLKWTQVSDLKGFDNAVARTYGITSIPQNFLVDPNGVIVASNLRAGELEQKLAEIFNK